MAWIDEDELPEACDHDGTLQRGGSICIACGAQLRSLQTTGTLMDDALYEDGMERLQDHIWQAISRHERRPIYDAREAGNIGPVVAAALKDLSADIHEDEAEMGRGGRVPLLSQPQAALLKMQHGTVRDAARAAGISKSAFGRALNGSYSRKAA